MPHVKIEICRFVDPAQPGWVECRLIDASGDSHIFIEKIPIVTQENLWTDSSYPARGEIACRIVARHTVNERVVCTIDTELPWGIESTAGVANFDVYANQLIGEITELNSQPPATELNAAQQATEADTASRRG